MFHYCETSFAQILLNNVNKSLRKMSSYGAGAAGSNQSLIEFRVLSAKTQVSPLLRPKTLTYIITVFFYPFGINPVLKLSDVHVNFLYKKVVADCSVVEKYLYSWTVARSA